MSEQTCKTFATPREAAAFMMGFRAAASEDVFVRIDPQEPQTVLVDCEDDEAEGVWLRAIIEWQKLTDGLEPKQFTVVGLCLCGCDESFVFHTEAKDAAEARSNVVKDRKEAGHESQIIAVFEGRLQDVHED